MSFEMKHSEAVEEALQRIATEELDDALELLRRRMDLAAEVGRVKAASNIPVVVRDVEDRVLTRARQHAESCGVSEEVMAGVFQAILSGSVERQYRVGIALREQRGGRVLIVGGAGGMGNWFRGFLELAGHSVDVPLYRRERMEAGVRVAGPAIIAEDETSTFVTASFDARIDGAGCIVMERRAT